MSRVPGALSDLRAFARYARRLPGFVRATVTPEEAIRRVERQLHERQESFLRTLAEGVYRNSGSPYRALLEAVGAELGDVDAMVRRDGIEPALAHLRDAGVHVTLDEFKGRRPIERPGLSIPAGDRQFDNPLAVEHFEASTGGSRGRPRRVSVDLDMLEHETAYHSLFRTAFDLRDRPFALWRVIPPSASGINNAFRQAKLGLPVAHWFNPHRGGRDAESIKFAGFTRFTVALARAAGVEMPRPDYCPPQEAGRVARWLADRRLEGAPAVLDTQVGLGVRVCLAARAEGLDISGTFFRFGGEPYTEARERVVLDSGCFAVAHYTMAETGRIAVACAEPSARDDVHFLADKLAFLQRDQSVGSNGARVGALTYTTLLPSSAKLMLNVESDDYAVLERRACGCPFGELGFTQHMHGIHSYGKLTAEGNHFLGSDLIRLVDEVLPERFGGGPTDYQIVEEEVGALPKVTVVVRPSVGRVEEPAVIEAVLGHLRAKQRNRLMAEVWREGGTLRVARRELYATPAAGKILPLQNVRGG